MSDSAPNSDLAAFGEHERLFGENRFVYPVLSRRSRGISVGVNLNPDKVCNFDCIYCQVNRTTPATTRFVETEQLLAELERMLSAVTSGAIYGVSPFDEAPEALRRLNDIAFSGDGEPTTYRNFDELMRSCADVKRAHGLDDVKLVLITNASMFHRDVVRRGLEILDANQGEIWAKLDAGTEEYYRLVDATPIPFQQVVENITEAARVRPLVIQSLFMRIRGEAPPADEVEAFCERLNEITSAGGQIQLVQLYTIARRPPVEWVEPLEDAEVDAMVARVRERTGLTVEPFYGSRRYLEE